MRVLGIDPGLAHMGLSMWEVRRGQPDELLTIGLVETKIDQHADTATGDVLRRLRLVVASLDEFVKGHDVRVICAEGQSSVRDARAASMMAMAWGGLVSYSVHVGAPILVAYPQSIKKAAGVPAIKDESKTPDQLKRLSKKAVQVALSAIYPKLGEYLQQLTGDRREHPADSVGAFHALRKTVHESPAAA